MLDENLKRVKALAGEVAVERSPEKFQELVGKLRIALESLGIAKPAKPGKD